MDKKEGKIVSNLFGRDMKNANPGSDLFGRGTKNPPKENFNDKPYHRPQRDLREYSEDDLLDMLDSYDQYNLSRTMKEVPPMTKEDEHWRDEINKEYFYRQYGYPDDPDYVRSFGPPQDDDEDDYEERRVYQA